MIDFEKAFDRMNQESAAISSRNFLQSPHLLNWIYDFSIDRSQRLMWKGKSLPYMHIDRGCAQGTVGGPNLFSIHTDDAKLSNSNAKLFKYSDDFNAIIPCKNNSLLKNEIQSLEEWALEKGLTINMKKIKVVTILS